MSIEAGSLKGPPRFSEQEDDVLISVIAPTASLYDPENDNFKNPEAKAALWLGISKIVKRDVESCKRRWKDIKNNYFKIKRQHKMDSCKWSLYEKLRFLDRIYENSAIVGRRMLVSPPNEDDRVEFPSGSQIRGRLAPEVFLQDPDSRSGMDLQPSTSGEPTVRKRRFEEVSSDEETSRDRYRGTPQERDDVDLFMRSIALQMKTMSPRKIAQAKVRILTVVNELQFGQMRMGEP
ncbi:uncharacterized protein [Halyomorpha halys]|uniref:uncharacterized protein n=1 Tax=Halyomorpha halys TaxID=286706 RepID=UPI0006D511F1|nr:uncharacterized protein LOC106692496 [Halyomorpha halys]